MTTLEEIADAVHKNATEKGFHNLNQPLDMFLLEQWLNEHAEISELVDARRVGKLFSLCDKAEKMQAIGHKPLTCIEEEYADILIRCLDQMKRAKIDILRVVLTKHAYNQTRPYKHGKIC